MIDKSFIEKIQEMARRELVEVNGRQYSTSQLILVPSPRPKPLIVRTLTGLVAYLKANRDDLLLDEDVMVLVNSPTSVHVIDSYDEHDGGRTLYLGALVDMPEFAFGQWFESEPFVIDLLSLFLHTADHAKILRVAGNLRAEAVKQLTDDGVTQHVVAKSGIAQVEDVQVPSPVVLSPFRTFRELEQVESCFVFRVRDCGQRPPECALFEAGGAAWRLEAVERIRLYLGEQLTGMGIPVIA